MKNRTKEDFWTEMSIREIWTQAHFAEIAYNNIDPKAVSATDVVFSSIHSFFSHCAMISKMLSSKDAEQPPKSIGNSLGISQTSIIHDRKFRNHLEHYDERLKKWIKDKGVNIGIGTYNIGPKSAFKTTNMIFISHYDPTNHKFTFVDEDFDLQMLYEEVVRIKNLANQWVKAFENSLRSKF